MISLAAVRAIFIKLNMHVDVVNRSLSMRVWLVNKLACACCRAGYICNVTVNSL